jgi:chain length determinant protein tyrosine kinase EpsG
MTPPDPVTLNQSPVNQSAIAAAAKKNSADRSIGAILVDAGKLKLQDAERVLRLQKERGLRFGDAAIELGLVTAADIQFALARQFDYPYLVVGESKASAELVAAFEPFGTQVEALRALRSQLMLRWFTGAAEQKILAIVSPGRGEGRSYIAANLAIVCSQLGERTLLIDADMRYGRQHELFHLDNGVGLSTDLSGRTQSASLQRVPNFVDLTVLTAGPTPPNPQELLCRPAFAQMLGQFAATFDVIVIDTPAAGEYADAQTLAARARGALLVLRQDRSSLNAAAQVGASLTQVGVTIVGSVLNDF